MLMFMVEVLKSVQSLLHLRSDLLTPDTSSLLLAFLSCPLLSRMQWRLATVRSLLTLQLQSHRVRRSLQLELIVLHHSMWRYVQTYSVCV